MARALRPNGVFILADMIMPYWLWLIFRHGQHVSAKQRRTMFTDAGLEIQAQKGELWHHLLITVGKKSVP